MRIFSMQLHVGFLATFKSCSLQPHQVFWLVKMYFWWNNAGRKTAMDKQSVWMPVSTVLHYPLFTRSFASPEALVEQKAMRKKIWARKSYACDFCDHEKGQYMRDIRFLDAGGQTGRHDVISKSRSLSCHNSYPGKWDTTTRSSVSCRNRNTRNNRGVQCSTWAD